MNKKGFSFENSRFRAFAPSRSLIHILILFAIAFAFSLQSCRTVKVPEQRVIVDAVDAVEIKDVLGHVMANQPDFNTMNISRMNLSFRIGGQSHNVRGFIRMVRDSAIIISIQPILGIEMVRAQILPDSITVIDRINSQYYVSNPEQLKAMTGINFEFNTLQALLSNQLFLSGVERNQLSEEMFDVRVFPPQSYEIRANENSLPFNHSFIINRHLQLERAMLIDRKNPQSLTFDYSDFKKVNEFDFPHRITITTLDGRRTERINLTIGNVEFDVPVNMSFSVPARFSRVDIENISF